MANKLKEAYGSAYVYLLTQNKEDEKKSEYIRKAKKLLDDGLALYREEGDVWALLDLYERLGAYGEAANNMEFAGMENATEYNTCVVAQAMIIIAFYKLADKDPSFMQLDILDFQK